MIQSHRQCSRFALLVAAAAVAFTFSAGKASANTIVSLTSYGTSSGLTGVISEVQQDKLNITGLPATDQFTTSFLFPTLGTTDTWGIPGNNGWVIIDAPGGSSVAAVIHFDNVTDIGSTPYQTLYYYGPGNLPPSADYTFSGSPPPDDTVTITEDIFGVATYDPAVGQPGYGYTALAGAPANTTAGGTQLDFSFTTPDGANTLCILGAALTSLALFRRRLLAC